MVASKHGYHVLVFFLLEWSVDNEVAMCGVFFQRPDVIVKQSSLLGKKSLQMLCIVLIKKAINVGWVIPSI